MSTARPLDPEALARAVLDALDTGQVMAAPSGTWPGLDISAAYRVTAALRRLREARGERHMGRKLGFTNRRLWAEYGVTSPIWGDVFDSTLRLADPPREIEVSASTHLEPKIEPEIAFGLSRAPEPGMDEAGILDCIGWVAHGIEIVHSPFGHWRITAADAIAGACMHRLFILGPQHPLPRDRAGWHRALTDFWIMLLRNGEEVEHGHALEVLDGPVSALCHLVALLAEDPDNPPLAAGEFVTTGSLTRALDLRPGERWETRIEGLGLPGLRLRIG